MTNFYGGDEVGAVVFDVGSSSIKVGYAGEDSPKSEISSIIAIHDAPTKLVAELDRIESAGQPPTTVSVNRERRYFIDTNEMSVVRSGQEVKSFLTDGEIDEWDLFEKILDYIYAQHIMSEPSKHPVMFSEVPWNSKKSRDKLTEIMFEKYNIPAFYLAKNAMLVAFSTGRPTGVVFDSGAKFTAAIPVYEGYVLERAIKKNHYAGDFITSLCYNQLTEKKIDVNPRYLVNSKSAVEPDQPANWTKKTLPEGISTSWHNYMLSEELRNYKTCVLKFNESKNFVLDEIEKDFVPVNYEFPDGYNINTTIQDQYLIPELFFKKSLDLNQFKLDNNNNSFSFLNQLPLKDWQTYPDLLLSSVAECDIDIRPAMLSSIILAGGNTLFEGFTDRMTTELVANAPMNFRMKIAPNNTPLERKYAAWIGGSILASLGTFQQLWISSLEYGESGKLCLEKRVR